MKKQTALFLTLTLTLLYLLWLVFSGLRFMPSAGYRVHCRNVSNNLILEGRDTSGPRSLLPGEQIDLNTADAADLQRLPGVGPALASVIIEYREENGDFQTVEDLKKVPGIGDKRFESIRDSITIGGLG